MPTPRRLLSAQLLLWLMLVIFLRAHMGDIAPLFHKFTTDRTFSGDEIQYLRMLQSLSTDGDIELSNLWQLSGIWGPDRDLSEQEAGEGAMFLVYRGVFTGKNGGTYCIHVPGLSALMLPAYLLDLEVYPNNPENDPALLPLLPEKLKATRALFSLGAVLAVGLLFRLLTHVFMSQIHAFGLILVLLVNSPFSGYIYQIEPDLWIVVVSLLVLNALFFPFLRRWVNDLLIVGGLGFLPWLHQRAAVLALGMGMVFLINRRRDRDFFRRTARISAGLAAAAFLYLGHFYVMTGSFSPLSPYLRHGKVYSSLANLPLAFFGNLFHPVAGFVWNYPWTILSLIGIYWGWNTDRRLTIRLLLIAVPYYLVSCTAIPWSGATWPKNRFLVALYPFLIIFLGFTLKNLVREFSRLKLAFYLLILGLIFLNRELALVGFPFPDRFHHPMIRGIDVLWMLESTAILGGLYLIVRLGDRYVFSRRGRPR